ncbi:uncharacterized protein B0H64DRAFT_45696 [Chaetomium fimeti]|uniref:Uncharacterized protein n=1 Tax=Chaetomium fimeti TaxID=1854472 RepID=A0AAE0H7U2_9PEZI|nr:hypothetical protein B0H64DRAFT_45696 [Chaetomium fimeti]
MDSTDMDIDNPRPGEDATEGGTGSYNLTFKITTTLQDELDAFVRYSRLGLFRRAQEVYADVLEGTYDTLFPVTAELADSLLEQGSFHRLSRLMDSRLRRVEELGFEKGQVGLLQLLKALTDLHHHGNLRSALSVARSWREHAATFMIPVTLSTVDKLSLAAYLRIVAFAYTASNWLRPHDMQPPWQNYSAEPWLGFYHLFRRLSGEPADAWSARSLFRPLIASLSLREAAELYEMWLTAKRAQSPHETDEEELLADLSITTSYGRKLIASGNTGDRTIPRRINELLGRSQGLLGELTTLIQEVDDLTNIRIRPALELDLARLEQVAATVGNPQTYDFFLNSGKQTWLLARKNHDLVTQMDWFRIQHIPAAFGVHTLEGDIFGDLRDWNEDMLGYVTAMADRILSVPEVATILASSPKLGEERTESDTAAMQAFRNPLLNVLDKPWGVEDFETWLDSSAMTIPMVTFRGSVARLLLAQPTEVKGKVAGAKRKILEVWQDMQWPLHCMVGTGYIGGVQLLLQHGARLDMRDSEQQTPLYLAVKVRNIAMVDFLLRHHAPTDSVDVDGHWSLSWAAIQGHEPIARLLIDRGANNNAGGTYIQTLLSLAIENGHETIVRLLLDRGADINIEDSRGQTPLSLAIENGHEAIVRLLFDRSAGINAQSRSSGQTSLALATGNGREGTARLPLGRDAHINADDTHTPAVQKGSPATPSAKPAMAAQGKEKMYGPRFGLPLGPFQGASLVYISNVLKVSKTRGTLCSTRKTIRRPRLRNRRRLHRSSWCMIQSWSRYPEQKTRRGHIRSVTLCLAGSSSVPWKGMCQSWRAR